MAWALGVEFEVLVTQVPGSTGQDQKWIKVKAGTYPATILTCNPILCMPLSSISTSLSVQGCLVTWGHPDYGGDSGGLRDQEYLCRSQRTYVGSSV